MDEASLCDRIALIQKGRLLTIDSPGKIADSFKKTLLSVSSENMSMLLTDLRAIPEVESCYAFGDSHHITLKNRTSEYKQEHSDSRRKMADDITLIINNLKVNLEAKNHINVIIKEIKPGIEDCFMELSKNNL
jgi:ABC-type multidrug transport system ATPase subunit